MLISDAVRNSNPAWGLVSEASRNKASESFAIPAAFAVLQFLTGFTFTDKPIFGVSQHVLDLIAGFVALSVFALIRVAHRRKKSGDSFRGFALWIVAGFVSLCVPQVFVSIWGWGIDADQLALFVNGLISYPLTMIALGVILSSRISSKKQLKKLSNNRKEMEALSDSLDEDIATMQAELTVLVRERLSKALDDLNSHSVETSGQIQVASNKLREVIDLVVRPLSLELASTSAALGYLPGTRSTTIESDSKKHSVETTLLKTDLAQLIAPLFFALSASLTLIPAFNFVYGAAGALIVGISILVIFSALWISRTYLGAIQVNAFAAIACLTLFTAVIGYTISNALAIAFDIQVDPLEPSIGLVSTVLINLLFLYFTARRAHAIEESIRINARIEEILARLRQEAWVVRKKLARLVHGKIQARLLAAAMRLSNISDPTQQDILDAKADVAEAVASLNQGESTPDESFNLQFQRLIDTWDGVCSLSLQASEATLQQIDSDPVCRTCLAEILGEAISNAAKHSNAAEVAIELTQRSQDSIEVWVSTDGILSRAGTSKPGYGSQILDEVTTSWELNALDGRVELRATLPIEA